MDFGSKLKERTMKKVTIKVQNVGGVFGCESYIMDKKGTVIWSSRVYPHGMRSNAYWAAHDEAENRGWLVVD